MTEGLEITLALLGVGGVAWSIYKWLEAYYARRRLEVSISRETYDVAESPYLKVSLSFEATNLGDKVTSLKPVVEVVATSVDRKTKRFNLLIQESSRDLASNTPKKFQASGKVKAVYPFTWYIRYKFRVTSGSGAVVRYRNASKQELSFYKFWSEWLLFRLFKIVPGGT